MIDLTEPAKTGEYFADGQPHLVFGRVEELDPTFRFMHDADDLIDYPFALVRWIDFEDVFNPTGHCEGEFSVTLLSESEVRTLAVWATKVTHEQFEMNRGHDA